MLFSYHLGICRLCVGCSKVLHVPIESCKFYGSFLSALVGVRTVLRNRYEYEHVGQHKNK